jgi:hypothetical protein
MRLLTTMTTPADAAGLLELRVASDFIAAGDHEVVVCDVVAWQEPSLVLPPPGQPPGAAATNVGCSAGGDDHLYSGFLRENGWL